MKYTLILLACLFVAIIIGAVFPYIASTPLYAPQSATESRSSPSITTKTLPFSKSFFEATLCRVAIESSSSDVSTTSTTVQMYCGEQSTGQVYAVINGVNAYSVGEVVDRNLYITRGQTAIRTATARQNQVWLYNGSIPVKLIYALPQDETSSIESISISPDETLIALALDDGRLDIITASGILTKSLSLAEMNVRTPCYCSNLPIGWGRTTLWTEVTTYDGSAYLQIGLNDWSIRRYFESVSNIQTNDWSLNFDTGELAISDIPFSDSFSWRSFVASTTTVHLFLDNLLTGATSTVASFRISALQNAFSPQWDSDSMLQYRGPNGTQTTTIIL